MNSWQAGTDAPSHPLDNVVWSALTGPHAHFARGDEWAKRYPPEVSPFGAVAHFDAASLERLAAQLGNDDAVALVSEVPVEPPHGLGLVMRASVHQMVWKDLDAIAGVAPAPFVRLGADDVQDMVALVAQTRPGPFGPRTIEMGQYLGVREGRVLLAMAGERMRLPGYTEVSAICVAPQGRGKGLAAGLVRQLVQDIATRGDTPFLHVLDDNLVAIALYERLGFRIRRQLCFAVFKKAGGEATA